MKLFLRMFIVGTLISVPACLKATAADLSPYQGQSELNQPAKIKASGTVIDENGETLIGAVIVENGAENSTVTDMEGHFSMSVSSEKAILRISYLGYVTVEIPAGKDLKIRLEPDTYLLSDVVVTGYQSLPRDRVTGAFKILSTDALAKPTTNIGSRLIGTVSGLQVKTDIDGNVNLEIRGKTSLNANAKPLIVVDGFPIEGDINTLNPNDIESVTILKDAAAASIWGAKSANGVISITTKGSRFSSTRGVTKVEISSFLRFQPKIDLDYTRSLASSSETIEYEKKAFDAWSAMMPTDSYSREGVVASFTPTLTAMNEHRLGYISEEEMNRILEMYRRYDNSEQIRKYLLQNPLTQQYNVNIASGNERSNNNLSLLYENNAYYLQGRNDWKGQVSYRNNTHLTKWLDLSFSGTFSYKEAKGESNERLNFTGLTSYQPLDNFLNLAPYEMLVDENGARTNISNGYYMPNINRYYKTENFPYDFTYNPITELESRERKTTNLNAVLQAGLSFKLMKGLTFDTKFQYELNNIFLKDLFTDKSYEVRKTVNQSCSYDRATGKVTQNLPLGGFLDQRRTRIDRWNFRNQINFNRQFGDRHEIIAIAGTEVSNRIAQNFNYPRAYGYDDNKLTTSIFPNGPGGSTTALRINDWLGTSQTFPYINSFTYRTDRFFSMYGNASYTFDSKYTLSGSVRTDASNLISDDPKYRYAPFWSIGGSWQLGRENFMKEIKWIDMLVPRITYGYNGNVDTSTAFMPLINMSSSMNQYTLGYTASVSSYGNPTLRWERTGTWNIGVDYSLFAGKLFGKFDFYNKNSVDLIASISIPSINGTNSQKFNNAEMTNKGIEIEVGTTQNIAKNIAWRGSLNFSYNQNKVTNLFIAMYEGYTLTGYSSSDPVYVQGYDANTLWTYVYDGIKNLGTENSPNWQPTIKGANGSYFDFGSWTSGDATQFCMPHGTSVAPYLLGLNNGFKIYDFDLSFIITGKFGHKFKRQSFNYPAVWNGRVLPNNKFNEVENGDPMKVVPLPMNGKIESRYYFWDRFFNYMDYLVEDAGHFRFQEVNLSYNIPSPTAKKLGLEALQLYAQANNLFSVYFNKYNEDPEYPAGTMKLTPSYTIGFKVSF